MESTVLANRYDVLAMLGQGAMGTVYRVNDRFADGPALALKTIKGDGPITEGQRLLFKEEFRAMTRLRHPNTLEVRDFGVLDGTSHYLTMELVEGQELEAVIGGKPMAFAAIYPLLIQLLQALDFIHSRRYVHRDIKAANIRVRADGTLKLMDFGLMAPLGQPGSGKVTGTPGYMAPEAARGAVVDAGSDLYAVGCLAYEMITGRLPFTGSAGSVVRAHVNDPVPPIKAARPDIPDRLERLVSRLLEKDPARRYRAASAVLADLSVLAGVAIAHATADQRASYLVAGTLIGREAELARLHAAMTSAWGGSGRTVLIGALAGVGKSRLVRELVLLAKLGASTGAFDGQSRDGTRAPSTTHEALVLHGFCEEAGGGPYAAIAASLRPALAFGDDALRQRHAAALAVVFPDCGDRGCSDPDGGDDVGTGIGHWLAELATERPILWVVEDLHWADPQTLQVLNRATKMLACARVLAIGTFREDEVPATSPLRYPIEEGAAQYLALGPLTPLQQQRLVVAMLPDSWMGPVFAEALYVATAGNAFFVSEILRALLEDGVVTRRDGAWHFPEEPDALSSLKTVEATITRRLAHFCEAGKHTLGVASVLGRHVDLELLLAASGLEEDLLLSRLEKAIEHQFLQREGDTYTFLHDRLREVLYHQLERAERAALHQKVGELLEPRRGADVTVYDLAHHFTLGTDPGRAYKYALEAGDLALEAAADARAVELWNAADAALEQLGATGLLEPHELRDMQLDLWFKIGGNSFVLAPLDAIHALERIHAVVRQAGPDVALPTELSEVEGLLAVAHGFAGTPYRAIAFAESLTKLVPADGSLAAATVRFAFVPAYFGAGRFDDVVATGREIARILDAGVDLSGQSARVRGAAIGSLGTQNSIAFQGYRPNPAIRDRADHVARVYYNDDSPFTVWMYWGLYPAWSGRHAAAQLYIDATVRKCRKLAAPPFAWVLYLRPYLLAQRGDFAAARPLVEQALSYPHVRQLSMPLHHLAGLRAELAAEAGDLVMAEAGFTALLETARERGTFLTVLLALTGLADVALRAGAPAKAETYLDELLAMASSGPLRNPLYELRGRRLMAKVALAQHDPRRAEHLLDAALAIATDPAIDNPYEEGLTLLVLGEALAARGERDAARRVLARAGDRFHALENPHWLHAVLQAIDATAAAPVPVATQAGVEARWQRMRGGLI